MPKSAPVAPARRRTPTPKARRPAKDIGALAPKQARFVEEYLLLLNATQAAIRAGYSAKTANEQGSRLLANASVAAAIATGQATLAKELKVEQSTILQGFLRLAGADIRKLFTVDRNQVAQLLPMDQWPDDVALAVQSVKVKSYYPKFGEPFVVTEFRLGSRETALTMLGKHLGLFTEVDKRPIEGTGVLQVPSQVSAEEWSRVTQLQQAKLGKG